jgi:ribonuclease HI
MEENEWHCFFGCTHAINVWQETEVGQIVSNYVDTASGFKTMMFHMLEEVEEENMTKIAMILWSLWWRRNQKCWNDKLQPIFEVTRRARDSLRDWLQVQMKNNNTTSNNHAAANLSWSKPPSGTLKCNIDTACYVEDNAYCAGICIRDSHGSFVKAYAKRKEGTPEIAEAEAQGVLEALHWLSSMHMENNTIELESDCLQVVQAINKQQHNNSEFGIIIDMCRSLLVTKNNWKVSYVRRQANRVAHELAQATRFIASHHIYNYCPPCIEHFIMNEMH